MARPTGVEGDLVPRADCARPETSISASSQLSVHEYESLSMNMKVWHAESWPKHLGSSDGSGESSAISAVGSDSTILPSPFESSRFCAGYRQCPLRQFSGSVSAGELSHFQELMTMAHLLGNSPPQIPKPTILRTSPASHLQNLEFV